jgi:hypothetical protein
MKHNRKQIRAQKARLEQLQLAEKRKLAKKAERPGPKEVRWYGPKRVEFTLAPLFYQKG